MLQQLENFPVLFRECVLALDADIFSKSESVRLSQIFVQMFPFTSWGRIDWEKIEQKKIVGYNPDDIIPALKQILKSPLDISAYIEWSSATYPIIHTDLNALIKCFDYVTCVSHVVFIFNTSAGYIIEIKGGDEATVGIVSKNAIEWAKLWYVCLKELGDHIEIYSYEISQRILAVLKNKFGFRNDFVTWHLIAQQKTITRKDDIVSAIETLLATAIDQTPVYIVWHETTLPVVETTLGNVIKNFDVIKSMGSTIWVFNESAQYVVEITPGEIKVGLRPDRKSRSMFP